MGQGLAQPKGQLCHHCLSLATKHCCTGRALRAGRYPQLSLTINYFLCKLLAGAKNSTAFPKYACPSSSLICPFHLLFSRWQLWVLEGWFHNQLNYLRLPETFLQLKPQGSASEEEKSWNEHELPHKPAQRWRAVVW